MVFASECAPEQVGWCSNDAALKGVSVWHRRIIDGSALRLLMARSGEVLDEKFRKADRILNRGHFRSVYESGRRVVAKYFTGFVLANSLGRPRIGITTTRKIGSSVMRNRARRLLREVFRKNKWRIPRGVDIVINVKSDLADASYQELESDFIRFLEKIE
jgi:ribonuclease P protein component